MFEYVHCLVCEGRSHGDGMKGNIGAAALNNSEYFSGTLFPNHRTE